MAEYTKDKHSSYSLQKMENLAKVLMDVYNDYLYMVREHEQLLNLTSVDELAEYQTEEMYPDGYDFPWKIEVLNEEEAQEYADYTANMIRGRDNHSYISLRHIKTEENNGKPPVFAIPPYTNISVGEQLPSKIECYTISHPKEVTFGDTEFYIDGRHKAVYTGEKYKNTAVSECLSDQKLLTEISVMLNRSECLRKNGYKEDEKFRQDVTNMYADEWISVNENHLLEIIGSFSEVVKDICHEKYKGTSERGDVRTAQRKGFLNLPNNFLEYDDIRNLMRHQWDTLEEWESFMPEKKIDDKINRAKRIRAYLKICDKPFYSRMQAFVGVLQQMQQVIAKVNPNRIIRGVNESDEAFAERLKSAYQKNPQYVEVELNYPYVSQEYWDLDGKVYGISPDMKIVDESFEPEDKFEKMFARMEDYKKRSEFLRAFNSLESYAIGYCIRRGVNHNKEGKNLTVRDAWDYMRDTGLMTFKDCKKWQFYTGIRHKLSHSYFDDALRSQLYSVESDFYGDLRTVANKLLEVGPDVRKKEENVYEYTNVDGRVVTLDHEKHLILSVEETGEKQIASQVKAEVAEKKFIPEGKTPREFCNGLGFDMENQKIEGVRLQNGVYINIAKGSIKWDGNTRWYTDDSFNALQVNKSKIRTNKELRVTGYFAEEGKPSYRGGDTLLIERRHSVVLDRACRIKEFKFKDAQNNIIKTEFEHTANGKDRISLSDGTSILISGKDVLVSHNNKILSADNWKEFALTYPSTQIPPKQITKSGYGR